MTWNYRIVKHVTGGTEWFGIHEVYYDDDGKPRAMTEEPVRMDAETVDDLIHAIEHVLDDARNHPVFEPPAEWSAVKLADTNKEDN